MKTSELGREIIEAFEGCILHAYRDSVGVLTIGYGHTNRSGVPPHIRPGEVWTHRQAEEALINDLAKFEADVLHTMRGHVLNQNQFDALVSFDFNTGHLARSSIPLKIRAGHLQAAMLALLQYDHAGGQRLQGLTRRRRAERALFEGRVNEALMFSGIHRDVHKGNPVQKSDHKEEN